MNQKIRTGSLHGRVLAILLTLCMMATSIPSVFAYASYYPSDDSDYDYQVDDSNAYDAYNDDEYCYDEENCEKDAILEDNFAYIYAVTPVIQAEFSSFAARSMIAGTDYIIWDFSNATARGIAPFFGHSLAMAPASPAVHTISIERMGENESHSPTSTAFLGTHALRWEADWADGLNGSSGIGTAGGMIPQNSDGRNPTSIGMWMRLDGLELGGFTRMFLGVSTLENSTTTSWRGFSPTVSSITAPATSFHNAHPGAITHEDWVFVEFPLNTSRWTTQGQGASTGTAFSSTQQLWFPNAVAMNNPHGTFLGFRHGYNSLTGEGAIYISGLTFFFNYNDAGAPYFGYAGLDFFGVAPGPTFGNPYHVLIDNIGGFHFTGTPTTPQISITFDGTVLPDVINVTDDIPVVVTLSGTTVDDLLLTLNGDHVATAVSVDGDVVTHTLEVSTLAALPNIHHTLRVEAWSNIHSHAPGFRSIEVGTFFLNDEPSSPTILTDTLGDAIYRLPFVYEVFAQSYGAVLEWTIVGGNFPAGLNLIPITPGVMHIIGSPEQHGSFVFTVRTENIFGGYDEAELTLVVLPPVAPTLAAPTPLAGELPSGALDVHYSVFLGVESDYPVYWSISTGALPPGLEIIQSPSLISGMPTQIGTFTFTVRAADYGGYDEREFTVVIEDELIGGEPGDQPIVIMDRLFINSTSTAVPEEQTNSNVYGSSVTGVPLFVRRGVRAPGTTTVVWEDWVPVEHCGVYGFGEGATMRRTPEGFFQLWAPVEFGLNVFEFFQPGVPMVVHAVNRLTPISMTAEELAEIEAEFGPMELEIAMIAPAEFVDIAPAMDATTMFTDGTFERIDNFETISWAHTGTFLLSAAVQNTGFGNATLNAAITLLDAGQLITFNVPNEPTFRYPHNPANSIFQSVTWTGTRLELRLHDRYTFNGVDLRRIGGRYELFIQTRRPLHPNPDAPFTGFTFALDIGHGNSDPGALGPMWNHRCACCNSRWTENDINYANVRMLQQRLEALGANVVVTGTLHQGTAAAVTLSARSSAVQGSVRPGRPDAFLSFHADASLNNRSFIDLQGYTIWSQSNNNRNVATPLARHILDYLYDVIPTTTRDDAVNFANFGVINQSWQPSVLLEVGFMVNVDDFRWMITPGNQEILADRHVEALLSFFPAVEICGECGEYPCDCPVEPLATPALAISGSTASWNAVAGAISYRLYVNSTQMPNVINATYFNLVSLGLAAGTYNIQVRAISDGAAALNSNLSNIVAVTVPLSPLQTPTNFTVAATIVATGAEYTITWDAVAYATSYRIYINGVALDDVITTNSFHIALEFGSIADIRVRAIGNGVNHANSAQSSVIRLTTPAQLQAPALTITGTIASWNAIADATQYTIYVNGAMRNQVATTNFDLLTLGLSVGSHDIQVRAGRVEPHGTTGHNIIIALSALSNTVAFIVPCPECEEYPCECPPGTQLNAPTISLVEDRTIRWISGHNSIGYAVYVNSVRLSGVIDSSTSGLVLIATLPVEIFNVGTNSIQVRAIGDGHHFLDSNLSNIITFTVQTPPPPPPPPYTPSVPVTPAPPTPVITIPVNNGEVTATVRIEDNQATLNLTTANATHIVNTADGNIVMDLSELTDITTVVIPRAAWNRFANAPANHDLGIELILYDGSMTFDRDALRYVSRVTGSQPITISITTPDEDNIFAVSVTAGTNVFSELNGILAITIPFTGNYPVAIWMLDSNGILIQLPTSINRENGTLTFETTTLATFVIDSVPAQLNVLEFTIGSLFYLQNGIVNAGVAAPFMDTAYDRVMVPIRTVAYALGFEVDWIPETRTVVIYTNEDTILLPVGIPLPDGMGTPVITGNRAFVPLRFVAEALGADADWDSATQAVTVIQ